jgi:hypothetical protein
MLVAGMNGMHSSPGGLSRIGNAKAAWPISVELVLAHLHQFGLDYAIWRVPLPAGREPDRIARETARRLLGSQARAPFVHSTSWRREGASVLLTYIAYSRGLRDGVPVSLEELQRISRLVAAGKGEPGELTAAVHAVRHLAFLAGERPTAMGKAIGRGAVALLGELRPASAGRLGRAKGSAKGKGARASTPG